MARRNVPSMASMFSAPMGRAYLSDIALLTSTLGTMWPTGLSFRTRFSRFSTEQRAPFFVLNLRYASRHTATTSFWLMAELVSHSSALAFARSRNLAAALASSSPIWSVGLIPSTHSTPISTSGNTCQNESSTTNLLPMTPPYARGPTPRRSRFSTVDILTTSWYIKVQDT